jgi:hypothetical protein
MLVVFWIITVALIWAAWRFLTANNVELVHYPQYVPEGMALVALTLSPVESLAWAAILGGLDEGFQYAVVNRNRMVQFDFNDIFMDILGAAAGVLLAMAFLRCEPQTRAARGVLRRPGLLVVYAMLAIGMLLWSAGLMLLYRDPANTHYWFALSREKPAAFLAIEPISGPKKFHTLSPVEGPILILSALALYAILDRRVRISVKPAAMD